MRHLLDFQDVNKNHLENLIEESRSLKIKSKNLDTLALLKFDEPSTRTRLSFAIAAEKLGIKTYPLLFHVCLGDVTLYKN